MALDRPDDDFARPDLLQGVIDASGTGSTPDTCTPAAANLLAIFRLERRSQDHP
jgi:hypothetical protein